MEELVPEEVEELVPEEVEELVPEEVEELIPVEIEELVPWEVDVSDPDPDELVTLEDTGSLDVTAPGPVRVQELSVDELERPCPVDPFPLWEPDPVEEEAPA